MPKLYNKSNIAKARYLRNNMTAQEGKLWYLFLKEYRPKFQRQKTIGSYIVDFYCAQAKLVIELDGSQHYSEEGQEYDKRRTELLNSYGIYVLRFPNNDIDNRLEEIKNMIDREVAGRIGRYK